MDNKTKVKSLRAMADHFDEIANLSNVIEDSEVALHYRNIAEHLRKEAEKLDPPEPEWGEGDLVRDCKRRLWEYHGGFWYAREFGGHKTELLTSKYGPLTRVVTYDPSEQQYADPYEWEVVVSLEDIDLDYLSDWADEDSEESPFTDLITSIVAKAAREQLGETQ